MAGKNGPPTSEVTMPAETLVGPAIVIARAAAASKSVAPSRARDEAAVVVSED